MPPPDMPPSIQKPQKSSPISARTRRISVSVYRLPAHGMMVWMGPSKLRCGVGADGADVAAAADAPAVSSRMRMASRAPAHSASERSRYFSVTISRMGPTSWAMPPWTSTRLCCSCSRVAAETSAGVEDLVTGSRHPRLTPNSGSPSAAPRHGSA